MKISNTKSIKNIQSNYLNYIVSILILALVNFLLLINLTDKSDFYYMTRFNSLVFWYMLFFSLLGIPLLFEGKLWKPKMYIKTLCFFTLAILFLPLYFVILIGAIHAATLNIMYSIEIIVYLYVSILLIKIMLSSLNLIKTLYSDQTVKTIIDIYTNLFNFLSLSMVLVTAYLGMAGVETSKNMFLYTLLITLGLITISVILYIINYGKYAKMFIKDLVNGFKDNEN